ncbi:unnamed protein product [Closterium sp. Yama58-4]|nr:unnamed protein product [Closterium sp. Yama58-4]
MCNTKPEALRIYVEVVGGVGLTDTTLPHIAALSCKSPPHPCIAPSSTKRAHCSGPLLVEGLRGVGAAIAPSLISSSTLSPLFPSLVPFSPLSSPPPLLPLASPPPLSQPLLPSLIPSSHCSSTPSISDPVLPSLIPSSPISSPPPLSHPLFPSLIPASPLSTSPSFSHPLLPSLLHSFHL